MSPRTARTAVLIWGESPIFIERAAKSKPAEARKATIKPINILVRRRSQHFLQKYR